jgi:hypothetical protein
MSPETDAAIASRLGKIHPRLPVVSAVVHVFVGGAQPLGVLADHGAADRVVAAVVDA